MTIYSKYSIFISRNGGMFMGVFILPIIGILFLISSFFDSAKADSIEQSIEEDQRHEEKMRELKKISSKKKVTRKRMARDEKGRFVSEEVSIEY